MDRNMTRIHSEVFAVATAALSNSVSDYVDGKFDMLGHSSNL